MKEISLGLTCVGVCMVGNQIINKIQISPEADPAMSGL